jgi:photosystem II stability/assembly factor-like uncharacterized protein
VAGGIFRSTDAGASWSFTPFGTLRAITIDPATPTTVYAVGDGVLKSTDAGANWTSVRTGGDFACVAIAPSALLDTFSRNLKVTVAPLSLNPTVIWIR